MGAVLAAEPGVAVLNKVELNQAVIRFGAAEPTARGDALTQRVIERIQADGICFASGAQWKGLWVMRLSVISWFTTDEQADRALAAIIAAWRAVQAEAEQA